MKCYLPIIVAVALFSCDKPQAPVEASKVDLGTGLREINHTGIPQSEAILALVGVNLINGIDSLPTPDQTVIITGNLISRIGHKDKEEVPEGAEVIDGNGLTLMPGLIDAHFHLDGNKRFPKMFLTNGVTSVRDPGAWIESYMGLIEAREQLPRLFLTGPHLDMPPPAYPKNSYLVRDPLEAREAVLKFLQQGSSAIKVYFRLPPVIIEEICRVADQHQIPVVAHLEITSATEAINAGVDGIEHITSFGTDLLPIYQAEQYRQSVIADNNARRDGRYLVWNQIDLNHHRVDSLLVFLKQQGTVVCPTLGAFEYRFGEEKMDTLKVRAFENMLSFTGLAHQSGIPVVVGSHAWVPYAETGWSFQHEMELLSECGMTNMEVIQAGTIKNARYLRIQDRLGSIEPGKQADLLLLRGDPSMDLAAMHEVEEVILNGSRRLFD